jgi:putative SOS response-associated peptidase YedK
VQAAGQPKPTKALNQILYGFLTTAPNATV